MLVARPKFWAKNIGNGVNSVLVANAKNTRPLQKKARFSSDSPSPVQILCTVGLSVILQNVVLAICGSSGRTLFDPIGQVGRILRATSDDKELATLFGINEKKIYAIALGLGISL